MRNPEYNLPFAPKSNLYWLNTALNFRTCPSTPDLCYITINCIPFSTYGVNKITRLCHNFKRKKGWIILNSLVQGNLSSSEPFPGSSLLIISLNLFEHLLLTLLTPMLLLNLLVSLSDPQVFHYVMPSYKHKAVLDILTLLS